MNNEAKYTVSYKFLIYQFSLSHVKIDFCPGDDLQTLYPSEADADRRCWTIQTYSDELNWARLRTFMNLTH